MTAELRRLWREAFGDTEEFLDAFFAHGFSPDRHHCICENNVPVSALYWFDCTFENQKFAYLYAVATLKSHRGKGLARRLLEETHTLLHQQGYAGAILVPGSKELFAYYHKLGYRKMGGISELSCQWGNAPVAITEIDADRYARLRKRYLPRGGVVQEKETLQFLHSYAKFYEGEDFLLCATAQENTLLAQELLGNALAAPGILRALNLPTGQFRIPGGGRDFALLLPLEKNCCKPSYFGLALD